ncbi:neurotransmitter-gated ion-channel ligand-binding domain-containing protein [Hyaloraphidium curvatum]|nr:neurotransmitter-gated ion-channel ligand-binding domain-containing protein [Hyaloraphidium curvatum]
MRPHAVLVAAAACVAAAWPFAAAFPDKPSSRIGAPKPSRRDRRLLLPRAFSDTNATLELIDVLTGPGSGYDASTRPSFGGPPDLIWVRFDINNLYAVDPLTSTFTVDASVLLWWTDPRLVAPPGEFPPTNGSEYRFLGYQDLGQGIGPSHLVWTPDIYFVNEVVVEPLDDIIKVQPDTGRVFWSRHMLADVTTKYDLAAFPFDRQNLTMELASYSYNERQILLEWDPVPVYPPIHPDTFTQVAWDYVSFTTGEKEYIPFRDQPPHQMLVFGMLVSRKTGSYYIKSFVPLMVLVALTTVSYWFSVDAVPERLGLSITLVLTIVSFYSSVTQGLPLVNYATTMDWWVRHVCLRFDCSSLRVPRAPAGTSSSRSSSPSSPSSRSPSSTTSSSARATTSSPPSSTSSAAARSSPSGPFSTSPSSCSSPPAPSPGCGWRSASWCPYGCC